MGHKDFPLLPLVFYVKTKSDLHVSLATLPFTVTIGIFNQHLVPNFSHKKGKSTMQTAKQKLQDEHKFLKLILEELAESFCNQGGIATMVMKREVILQPWIHFVIGDVSGNNELCGHFNHH